MSSSNKIIMSSGGIFKRATTRPVGDGNIWFESTEAAAKAHHISQREVAESANTGTRVQTPSGPKRFQWPSLTQVQTEWSDHVVVTEGYVPAKPCVIHYKTPGKYAKKENVPVRSITATRGKLGLSQTAFDSIAHHIPGWQDFLPPCVVGISFAKKSPKNPPIVNVRPGPYFLLKQRKNDIIVVPIEEKFKPFKRLSDIPDLILKNGEWVE